MKNSIIIFTRLPLLGETKSRLRDFLAPEAIQRLSQQLLEQTYQRALAVDADLRFSVTSAQPHHSLKDVLDYDEAHAQVEDQQGHSLGERMEHAMEQAKQAGYDKVVLIGSDLYDLTSNHLLSAFQALDHSDVVIAPTYDGGYGLIGWQTPHPELFAVEGYGGATVYQQLQQKAHQLGLNLTELPKTHDIDTKEDLVRLVSGDEAAHFLAQGEYNANFLFNQDSELLRVALGSQLHLEHQIDYEYHALEALAISHVTPKPHKVVSFDERLQAGYLVEEYLPGRALNYTTDWQIAAELLARVHRVPTERAPQLIRAREPFAMMMAEFQTMFRHYQEWEGQDKQVTRRIQTLLDRLGCFDLNASLENPCIINTELNSSNFLINHDATDSYIIDWEKPLIGEREQDLGHFLAPTTTRWKTDDVFTEDGIARFVAVYNQHSDVLVNPHKLTQYLLFTCLRGLTWCAMAYVQYQTDDKVAKNEQTFHVIQTYLSDEFLTQIEQYFDTLLSE
ncbi:MAG: TIGR04282 family arsenosugar biosynthesis glycosyltransferase [Aerococcus sp.]|nr:TIGR04282 family arsenosugar biosynthesis glycosyltransferase [Aerococcus sp.]